MIILLGRSGAGKSTNAKALEEKYGYKKIITYTTRPPREDETNGIDYHFVSNEEFKELKDKGFFGETGGYRGWMYGSAIEDYSDNSVLVVTPSGMRQIYKNCSNLSIVSFYIDVDRRSAFIKTLERKDDIEEAYRRSLSDVGQFDDVGLEVDFIIDNKNYLIHPNDLAYKIHNIYKRQILKGGGNN